MPVAPFQLYEAIVTNGLPDPALPGHIEVTVPELYGEDPIVVPPMFPGWIAGGWQSVPGTVNPDDPAGVVQVIVAKLAENSFRWMGTSQAWTLISSIPGSCGARSGNGLHAVRMSDLEGAVMESAAGNQVVVAADGSVTVKGATIAKVGAPLIWLYDGGLVAPLERYIFPSTLFADLVTLMIQLTAVGVAAGAPIPQATVVQNNLTASLGAGAPYLSNRIFGS